MTDPVLNLEMLPPGRPWPTVEPFLFCVHHDDDYPKANASLGLAEPFSDDSLATTLGAKTVGACTTAGVFLGSHDILIGDLKQSPWYAGGLVDHADSLVRLPVMVEVMCSGSRLAMGLITQRCFPY